MKQVQGLSKHLKCMLEYDKWANEVLFETLGKLSEEQIRQKLPCMYFNSIQGTLSHMLIASVLWHSRMTGSDPSNEFLNIEKLWSGPRESWETLFPDYYSLSSRLLKQNDLWLSTLHLQQDPSILEEIFSYKDTSGQLYSNQRSLIYFHLINHSTHHRGQLSASCTFLGQKAPELDQVYYTRNMFSEL